jgi:hypothetical protein
MTDETKDVPSAEPVEEAAPDATEEAPDNAWTAMTDVIADFGENGPIVEPEATAEAADEPEEEPPEPAVEAEAEPEPEAQAEPEPEAAEEPEPDPEPTHEYQAEGEVTWSDDATVRFRADGQDVQVSSMDELVELAQKGVYMGRRNREIAETERGFETREADYQDKLKQAESLLDKVLFDDEAYEKVKEVAGKFRDPEFREGQEAKVRETQRVAQDQNQAQAAVREYTRQVGQRASSFFDEKMGDYEYVVADDKQGVLQEFFQGFAVVRAHMVKDAVEQARASGSDEIAARTHAEQAAFGFLTEEALASVMESREKRYTERLGSRRKTPEEKAKEHNDHVDAKLEQKRTRKSVRRGGAAPEPVARDTEGRPTTWDGAWSRIQDEFSALQERNN